MRALGSYRFTILHEAGGSSSPDVLAEINLR